MKFLEKALVVDIESERLGGRIGIGTIDKKRNFAREFRHYPPCLKSNKARLLPRPIRLAKKDEFAQIAT